MKLNLDGKENIIIEIKNDLTRSRCKITKKVNLYNFYVYCLVDPLTDEPFYVGKGKLNRFSSHVRESILGKIPHKNKNLYYKILKTIELCGSIKVVILYNNLSEPNSITFEKDCIKFYGRRDIGTGILTNLTDGGEGVSGRVITDIYREKMSKSCSGNKNGMYGKTHHVDSKRLISSSKTGKKSSKLTCEKLSSIRKGKLNPFYNKKHTNDTICILKNNAYKVFGRMNKSYVDLDDQKQFIIDMYSSHGNVSLITRELNKIGKKCSITAVKRRLNEWNIKNENIQINTN